MGIHQDKNQFFLALDWHSQDVDEPKDELAISRDVVVQLAELADVDIQSSDRQCSRCPS